MSNSFICKRCDSLFTIKSHLKSHLQRKNPCEFINDDLDREDLIEELYQRKLNDKTYDCDYCNMKFNHSSARSRHKKTCKSKPLDKISILENTVEKLVSQIDNQQSKIDEQQSKIEKLEAQPSNTTNNTTNNNTQINLNGIKLRDFGKENMDALPESLISSLFCDLRFRELLAQLHCDPNYPENHNIRIRSIKRNTMEIFRNNKWDLMNFTKGLNELLLQGHKIFKNYYKNDKERILDEDMDERDLREILSQLDKIQSLNKNEIKPLMQDLQMMLEEFKSTGSAIVIA
jgi:hypothetical protein